jgi:small multidrug resistance pump
MNISLVFGGWVSLVLAILFGVMGTIFLKLSDGFQRLKPVFYLVFFYSFSFIALTFAIKYIELSIVYAVWSGVGTILVASISAYYFQESFSLRKIIFLMFIILGVIGIHFSVDI